MIYTITGKIGGGKTLLALSRMVSDYWARGGCVVSNIAIDERALDSYLRKKCGRRYVAGMYRRHDFEAEPDFQLAIPWGVPGCPVGVFVDEAQLYYNSTQSRALETRFLRLVSFLTQSRKANVDVYFITQHDTTLWAQFRHQALFGYKCRDMREISLPFVGKIGGLGLHWSKYDVISETVLETGKTPLSADLFGLYDTRQMYDSQMTGLQSSSEIWQPVQKNTKGLYEIDFVSSGRLWPFGLRWVPRLFLFLRKKPQSGDYGVGGAGAESRG